MDNVSRETEAHFVRITTPPEVRRLKWLQLQSLAAWARQIVIAEGPAMVGH